MNKGIIEAVKVLQEGGTILYPTDTIWGIGCDATNLEAVKKVYRIKRREDSKSMLVLIDHENRLLQYVDEVPEIAYDLIEVTSKPLTIIYPGAKNLAENLVAEDGSIGIRVVNNTLCQQLIKQFKKPIVSTSANITGRPFPANFADIDEEIKNSVDYILDCNLDKSKQNNPSSIIKIDSKNRLTILRE